MTPLDTLILCGGRGTRAYPDTIELPKPLLPVAGRPVVEHLMEIYARQGHRRFVLATGYLGEKIEEYFASTSHPWEVVCVDTGPDTETGERVRLASEAVGTDRFFVTYADGLGNVDLDALVRQHVDSGALATVTTVPLPSQYGTLVSDERGRVIDFREKPTLRDHWINAGFFLFDRAALGMWRGQVLESEVLPALAEQRVLHSFQHEGFWKSMDTFKDRLALDELATSGDAPPWAPLVHQA